MAPLDQAANNLKNESAPYCTEFELLTNLSEVKRITLGHT